MKRFEIGKTYETRSICDHECVYKMTVISRTDKSVQYQNYDGEIKRNKVHIDADGEFIITEKWSMAPVFRASRPAK